MSTKRNLSSLSKKGMQAVVVSSNDKGATNVSPLRSIVVSTRIRVVCRMPFLRGISTLSIFSQRNSVLEEYMQGNNYIDIARDWLCVGNDMRAAITGWKNATQYEKE